MRWGCSGVYLFQSWMPPLKHVLYLVLVFMLTWTFHASASFCISLTCTLWVWRGWAISAFLQQKLTQKFPVLVSLLVPSFGWSKSHFPKERTGCADLSARGVSPALCDPGRLRGRSMRISPTTTSLCGLALPACSLQVTAQVTNAAHCPVPQQSSAQHKQEGKKGCSISTVSISGHSVHRQREALGSTLCLLLQSEMQQ